MKNKQLLYLFAALSILASCKKDDTKTNDTGIDGTYTFNGMYATTITVITTDDGKKITSLSDWTSANNQGTIVFDNGKATKTNFSYSMRSAFSGNSYQDNLLLDSVSSPLIVIIPITNSVSTYHLIGSDSIHFPKSGFVTIGSTTTTSNPGGGHYKLNGNQLTLNINGTKDSTFSDSGVMYKVQQSVVSGIVLQKQ